LTFLKIYAFSEAKQCVFAEKKLNFCVKGD
jgi:hypothetical protein